MVVQGISASTEKDGTRNFDIVSAFLDLTDEMHLIYKDSDGQVPINSFFTYENTMKTNKTHSTVTAITKQSIARPSVQTTNQNVNPSDMEAILKQLQRSINRDFETAIQGIRGLNVGSSGFSKGPPRQPNQSKTDNRRNQKGYK